MRSFLIIFLSLFAITAFAQPASYNIIWNTPSKNSSESMPYGGGDIGMNVWVQNGDLMVYVTRSGSFNEDNALMKAGRLRISLKPNVFSGKVFKQQLHLKEGFVTVYGENNGTKATVKLWADVNNPVAHFKIESNKKIQVEAAYSWKWAAPKNNVYKKDMVGFSNNAVLFYHYNTDTTIFDKTVAQQGLQAFIGEMYNPLKQLAFGGLFAGTNFVPTGTYTDTVYGTNLTGFKLKTNAPVKNAELTLTLHNQQVENINDWKQQLNKLAAAKNKNAETENQAWWKQFWARSFIFIDSANTNSEAWTVGRNFALFRYQLGCNAKGDWPTKFNGGLFTFDPIFTDSGNKNLTPDYRNWGGGVHTAQNQRLVYFPMIKNGDFDLLQPQLNFYMRILKNAELRTKVYWNHGGACFTEQMENYGLPNFAEYSAKRPADFDKGVEYNAWLEYMWDTVLEFCIMMLQQETYTGYNNSERIAFVESCLTFFDEHYQYLAGQRGNKKLDGNGKLIIYPGSGAETFKMANNSTSTIAALQTVTKHLLQSKYLSKEKQTLWNQFLLKLPPLNYTSFNGHTTIAPAKSWERVNNVESPQLYPVYPWGIYGVGLPGLDTAINTWNYDTNVIKFRSPIGWKQDNIWAARLGLTTDAWKLTAQKFANSNKRFPTFWGPGFDWTPDHNHGGSAMIGLQEMLMQTIDHRILIFPAWPKDKDVHFKLHAPYNTTVEAELKNGKIVKLIVLPENRRKDVEVILN
jgi:hypothetical protein